MPIELTIGKLVMWGLGIVGGTSLSIITWLKIRSWWIESKERKEFLAAQAKINETNNADISYLKTKVKEIDVGYKAEVKEIRTLITDGFEKLTNEIHKLDIKFERSRNHDNASG